MRKITALRFLCIFGLTLILSSCGTQTKRVQPKESSPAIQSEFNNIKSLLVSGKESEAIYQLENFITKHPSSDLADDAIILLGNTYYRFKKFEDAFTAYNKLILGNMMSPYLPYAKIQSAYCMANLRKEQRAYQAITEIINENSLSREEKISAYELKGQLINRFGEPLEQVKTFFVLSRLVENAGQRQRYELKALSTVESRLSESDLQKVAQAPSFGALRTAALFRLGLYNFEKGEVSRAQGYLSKVVSLDPEGASGEKAQEILQQIQARFRVDVNTIGAVLPLSGQNAAYGYRALKGLRLALGIDGKNRSKFRLAVVDSESNPSVARRAVERLVLEDQAVAIVGSLMSKTAVPVAAKSQELGVTNITLSQKDGLTDIGPYIFRNALTSRMQVQYLVHSAMEDQGYKRFAILYPNDKYGTEYANLFWDEVRSRGGVIVGAQTYEPNETDYRGHIQRLIGTFYVEDRMNEYQRELRKWKADNPHMSARKKPPSNLLKPVVAFDAIFIPDSVKAVGQIAPMMAVNDVPGVPLLGTNLWNTSSLVKRAGKYLEEPLFVDSFLSNDNSFLKSNFNRSFRATYGSKPNIIEVQAYDAGIMIKSALSKGADSRQELRAKLEGSKFKGALGPLIVTEKREVERPMVALTVYEEKISKVDPNREKKNEE